MHKRNPFGFRFPRTLRGWLHLGAICIILLSGLPVIDGLQAIGRGSAGVLAGLRALSIGLTLLLTGILAAVQTAENAL